MQEKLNAMKEYADAMLARAQALREERNSMLQNLSFQSQLTVFKQAAEDLKRCVGSPVQIGIVGEFNAGKTFLLSSLIGHLDTLHALFGGRTLLPIDNVASTGNVTVFRFSPQTDRQETEIGLFRVKFLNKNNVEECLAYMLREAKARAQAAGLSGEKLAGLNQLEASDPAVWYKIEPWGQAVWRSTENASLRSLIYEMVWFARAYERFGSFLCGRECAIDADTVRAGLKLPKRREGVQKLSFEDIPAPVQNGQSGVPGTLSAALLQDTFPLVSRIEVEVKMPKAIWDLSAVQGANPFDLLDFPGLGSMESGVRDEFLCKREMKNAQTILILLDSRTLHGKEAANIFNMMQKERPDQNLKDCVLVGVGRFDQLDLMKGQEDILDGLNSLPNPLSEERVLEKLGPLQDIRNRAVDLTSQEHQIIFLSPLLGLAALTKQTRPHDFPLHDYRDLQEAERMRQKWASLSERLEEGHLRRWLSEFVRDGGVTQLRLLIQNHVAAHGLKQLYQRARELEAQLRHAEQRLQDVLATITPTPSLTPIPDLSSFQESAMEVAREFNTLKIQYQHSPPKLQCSRNGAKIEITQAIYEEVIFRFFGWVEWHAIFNQVRDGYVPFQESSAKVKTNDPLDAFRSKKPIPVRSDDLYPAFEKTIQNLEGYAREITREAIRERLNELSIHFVAKREDVGVLFSNPQIAEDARKALQNTVDPMAWESEIFEGCAVVANGELTVTSGNLFPLPRTDASLGKTDRIFTWAAEVKDLPSENAPPRYTCHQTYIQMIRDELINSARRSLVQLASDVEKLFFRQLIGRFSDYETVWSDIANNDEFIGA